MGWSGVGGVGWGGEQAWAYLCIPSGNACASEAFDMSPAVAGPLDVTVGALEFDELLSPGCCKLGGQFVRLRPLIQQQQLGRRRPLAGRGVRGDAMTALSQ